MLKVHSGEDELLVFLFMPGSGIGEEETLLFLYVTSEVGTAFRTEFLMEEKKTMFTCMLLEQLQITTSVTSKNTGSYV